jgi:hypothetical protein
MMLPPLLANPPKLLNRPDPYGLPNWLPYGALLMLPLPAALWYGLSRLPVGGKALLLLPLPARLSRPPPAKLDSDGVLLVCSLCCCCCCCCWRASCPGLPPGVLCTRARRSGDRLPAAALPPAAEGGDEEVPNCQPPPAMLLPLPAVSVLKLESGRLAGREKPDPFGPCRHPADRTALMSRLCGPGGLERWRGVNAVDSGLWLETDSHLHLLPVYCCEPLLKAGRQLCLAGV